MSSPDEAQCATDEQQGVPIDVFHICKGYRIMGYRGLHLGFFFVTRNSRNLHRGFFVNCLVLK